ncbi:MAG: thiamine pyrophosphate-dependent dehydrogenase E1 component subunit alpha [Caldilineaceae bacterium SB0665_bin_25]|nr:thiamine pyrophosphate-dependent dehydrogenase E1 component subunit alpha [Caldilineaceae bacterium SB0665_bin_25]
MKPADHAPEAATTDEAALPSPATAGARSDGPRNSASITTDVLPSDSASELVVPALPTDLLLEMYRKAVTIRLMEEALLAAAEEGQIGGAMHTAIGHEANAIGAAYALRPGDYVTCTYRGHHHGLAWGMDPGRAIAEVMGRSDGFAKGKGGSMHFVSPELGMMGANGIVAAQVPHAAGLALASYLRGEERVAITFFGDGALFQGVMHETFNMASKWKLPLIFYCENNRYSEMTPIWRTSSIEDIFLFPRAYGMATVQIDGNDVEVVHAAVSEAAERARTGSGPTFIEGITYRLAGHMAGDLETYRPPEEVERQQTYEPLTVLRRKLRARGVDEDQIAEIDEEVDENVDEAVAFAENSPWPDTSETYLDVFAGSATGGG